MLRSKGGHRPDFDPQSDRRQQRHAVGDALESRAACCGFGLWRSRATEGAALGGHPSANRRAALLLRGHPRSEGAPLGARVALSNGSGGWAHGMGCCGRGRALLTIAARRQAPGLLPCPRATGSRCTRRRMRRRLGAGCDEIEIGSVGRDGPHGCATASRWALSCAQRLRLVPSAARC